LEVDNTLLKILSGSQRRGQELHLALIDVFSEHDKRSNSGSGHLVAAILCAGWWKRKPGELHSVLMVK